MTYLEELTDRLLNAKPDMDPLDHKQLMIEACDVLEAMQERVRRMEKRIHLFREAYEGTPNGKRYS